MTKLRLYTGAMNLLGQEESRTFDVHGVRRDGDTIIAETGDGTLYVNTCQYKRIEVIR